MGSVSGNPTCYRHNHTPLTAPLVVYEQGDAAAQVGSHKISKADESWHIDGHASNTSVAYFEVENSLLLQQGRHQTQTQCTAAKSSLYCLHSHTPECVLPSPADALTIRICWDDHSKIEADKQRGYCGRTVVTLRSKTKSAPYSDMGKTVKLGGAKVVVNSILAICPCGADLGCNTTSNTTRMSRLLVHKQVQHYVEGHVIY